MSRSTGCLRSEKPNSRKTTKPSSIRRAESSPESRRVK